MECDDDFEILSYPRAISQILNGLLENSINYAFETIERGHIELSFTSTNTEVQLVYKDNGKGICSAELQRIFEPFYTTYRHKGATGLGLYLVYNVVTLQLGGNIQVTSELDKGITFTVSWPI